MSACIRVLQGSLPIILHVRLIGRAKCAAAKTGCARPLHGPFPHIARPRNRTDADPDRGKTGLPELDAGVAKT